ncbi:MAG: C39 family peptidase [Oscillospiraceae bacterium]|nr:C39 family peptidase [Oscillospiraceae bacterium]
MKKTAAAVLTVLILLSGCSVDVGRTIETEASLQEPIPEISPEPSVEEMLDIITSSPEYPGALVKLALKNRETAEYVYLYPELQGRVFEADLSEEAALGKTPLFLQWDLRWGYKDYGGSPLGLSGCGPTCLSMVAVYLLEDPTLDPGSMAQFALENDFRIPGNGTSWGLFTDGCRKLGLDSDELPLDRGVMEAALDDGKPIVAVLGKGDFTDSGHFIVITGYGPEGFTVNDPNSIARSGAVWPYDRVSVQINNMWAMSRS